MVIRTQRRSCGRSLATRRNTSSHATSLSFGPCSRYDALAVARAPPHPLNVSIHPPLLLCAQEHVANKLDPTLFPYVKDSPSAQGSGASSLRAGASPSPSPSPAVSLRSQKPSWHKATRGAGTANDNRQRLLVFVAGGVTYSEMREAYLLSKSLGREVIIGESTFVPVLFRCEYYERRAAGYLLALNWARTLFWDLARMFTCGLRCEANLSGATGNIMLAASPVEC